MRRTTGKTLVLAGFCEIEYGGAVALLPNCHMFEHLNKESAKEEFSDKNVENFLLKISA
jgi:hypothetical protein